MVACLENGSGGPTLNTAIAQMTNSENERFACFWDPYYLVTMAIELLECTQCAVQSQQLPVHSTQTPVVRISHHGKANELQSLSQCRVLPQKHACRGNPSAETVGQLYDDMRKCASYSLSDGKSRPGACQVGTVCRITTVSQHFLSRGCSWHRSDGADQDHSTEEDEGHYRFCNYKSKLPHEPMPRFLCHIRSQQNAQPYPGISDHHYTVGPYGMIFQATMPNGEKEGIPVGHPLDCLAGIACPGTSNLLQRASEKG